MSWIRSLLAGRRIPNPATVQALEAMLDARLAERRRNRAERQMAARVREARKVREQIARDPLFNERIEF